MYKTFAMAALFLTAGCAHLGPPKEATVRQICTRYWEPGVETVTRHTTNNGLGSPALVKNYQELPTGCRKFVKVCVPGTDGSISCAGKPTKGVFMTKDMFPQNKWWYKRATVIEE